VLKNEGTLILHIPAYYRRWFWWRWQINFEVRGHKRPGYTKEEISKKIRNAGLEIQKAYYTYGWIETLTNNISYLITKAEMKNKILYSFIFPFLLVVSYLGQWEKPKKGAGVLVIAKKLLKN
jgi:hypothetical protein